MSPPIDFRVVFDASPNAYMLLDRELRYVDANRTYLEVTGIAQREDIVGRHILEAFPHDPSDPANENAARLRGSLERVLATGERDVLPIIHYRIEVAGPDGAPSFTDRYWSATHTPLLDATGRVEYILQHTVDVTDLHRLREVNNPARDLEAGVLDRARQAERANVQLDAELQRLRRVFAQAPGFMCFLLGPEHVYELANSAYDQLVGHREIIGRTVRAALPELVGQGFYELLDQVYERGETYVGRSVAVQLQRAPNGPLDERVLDFVYQPYVDVQGKVAGIFVQGNDITVQTHQARERDELLARERNAREEAERANRAKDEFLATMSHELRTPLNAMLGWTRMLRSGSLGEDKRARALETIERNARSQLALIEDVLDVSRIIAGKLRLQIAPVELMPIVEAAVDTVRPAADAKGVRLQVVLDPDAGTTLGDANRLQQVVWNLLSNAVKFTARGGRVHVRLARVESCVEVVVTDTGQGIPPEFLPYVFERFRQADATITRTHGGLGLGLAIVKHLVELHGGTVSVASEGVGHGASFTVRIPIAPLRTSSIPVPPTSGETPSSVPSIECPPAVAGLRIVVLDDEPDARELVQSVLEHCGAKVFAAGNVSDALDLLVRERPDVIVSDIGMPGEDGYSFIRRVRALPASEGGHTPAIALTAYARTDDRTRALMAGFTNHVPKPVEPAELLAVIASLVGRFR